MRFWVLLMIFLFLFLPLTTAQDEVVGAFVKSMESGEYSYLEAYLSPQMLSAFPESKFAELRTSLIEKYGRVLNATYAGTEGEYEYVKLNFERASVTFKLVIQDKKIAGLWIVGVSKRQEKVLTPPDAMMEALKTGNYSIVEPYLSPTMKKVFSEESFKSLRKWLITSYGDIKGYKFLRTEEKGSYTVYYYQVIGGKKNYTVTVTIKEGKVDGFHMTSIPLAFTPGSIYPIVGALIGLFLLWIYVRRMGWAELIFGMALLAITLIVQPPIQTLPRFAGISNVTVLILWTGLVAGVIQETLKYYASREKSQRKALYIGAGFGVGEAIYVSLMSMIGGGSVVVLSALERFLALLFHSSTTVIFSRAYHSGWGREALLALILVHWLVDSLTAYWQYNPSYIILGASYAIMLAVGLCLLKLLPEVKAEKEEETVKW